MSTTRHLPAALILLALGLLLAAILTLYPRQALAPLALPQPDAQPDAQAGEVLVLPLVQAGRANLAQAQNVTATDTQTRTVIFSYDPADRLTQMAYDDGTIVTYQLDASGNPIEQEAKNILHLPLVNR